jgi:hypothetical protein
MHEQDSAVILSEQAKADNAKANIIWRFYSDPAHRWRWECLAFDGTVLEHSVSGYKLYEGCVANACECGYLLSPSLSTKPVSTSQKSKRSYLRYSGK